SESDSSSTSIIQRSAAKNVDDTDKESEDIFPPKKNPGRSQKSLDEIENELIDDVKSSAKEKYMTDVGEKRFFKCSKCDNRLYILVHRTSIEVTIYKQDKPHEHNNENNRLIPTKTKDKVISMYFKENNNSKEISRWLRKNLHDGFLILDKAKAFHPFGILLSRTETHEDFEFMFSNTLLANEAMAITNGFKSVFTNLKNRIVCWAHRRRNMDDFFKSLGEVLQKKIVEDINFFQASVLKEHFETIGHQIGTLSSKLPKICDKFRSDGLIRNQSFNYEKYNKD
ncbi:hypothetical protein BpHYR1_044635, partial [Brachionus plicatilis]